MIKRREARQQAFELIFEKSFCKDENENAHNIECIIEAAADARDMELSPYARQVFSGVFEHIEEIDGYISQYSRARSFRRLSKVVLAALRLAIYEILYVDDLEPTISINEAIELTKKFSGKDEAGFVNGVLGGFMQAYPEIKAAKQSDSGAVQ
ncbi:MAG: transcription antitermination factor NusB [Firmicutes bacterium]|nr:transcription antitermination factor NusB [Bacillota bacterium]